MRFDNGMEPVDFVGSEVRGATISFREWEKQEGDLPKYLGCICLQKMNNIDKRFNGIVNALEMFSRIVHWGEWKHPSRFIMQYWERYYFYSKYRKDAQTADGFLAIIYNHELESRKIHIEIYEDNEEKKTFFTNRLC